MSTFDVAKRLIPKGQGSQALWEIDKLQASKQQKQGYNLMQRFHDQSVSFAKILSCEFVQHNWSNLFTQKLCAELNFKV